MTMAVDTYQEFALSWAKLGAHPLPKHVTRKSPNVTGWQSFRNIAPPEAFDTSGWPGMCVPMGGISRIEGIEFDADEKDKQKIPGTAMGEFQKFAQVLSQVSPALYSRVILAGYVEISPSGGVHLYVQHGSTSQVPGNEKWARWASGKTKIETRGDGGQFVVAPSPGYVALVGMPHQTPFVTPAERDLLKDLSSKLSERVIRAQPKPDSEPDGIAYVSPRGWDGVLEDSGWTEVQAQGSNVHAGFTRAWARPDHVYSEESGTYSAVSSEAVFMVFSSTAHGDLEDRGYMGREKSNGSRTYTMAEMYAAYNDGASLYGDDQDEIIAFTLGHRSMLVPGADAADTKVSRPRAYPRIGKKADLSRLARGELY